MKKNIKQHNNRTLITHESYKGDKKGEKITRKIL